MNLTSRSPEETFAVGERIAASLIGGEVILLYGGLGAGKTLLTKGVMHGLGFDIDEVTSPSFTLVNLYRAERFDVYHIDLWRLGPESDPGSAVGLDDILENERAVTIIEWADHLGTHNFPGPLISVAIDGDGDQPRKISVESSTDVARVTKI